MARKMTIPLAVIGGLGAGLGKPIQQIVQEGKYDLAMRNLLVRYTGIWIPAGGDPTFYPKGMKDGLVPLLAGIAVHKLVGGYLGINKALGQAGVPIIRI